MEEYSTYEYFESDENRKLYLCDEEHVAHNYLGEEGLQPQPYIEEYISDDEPLVTYGNKTDWNTAFKDASATENKEEKYLRLSHLSKDFVHASKLYAKVIISELYMPEAEKTIKPKLLGGVAGGDKYICQGILFKFALDTLNMYGGDQYAIKAAGHELKGLMCYYNCQIPDINVPLMALIDFRGFRVVAMSLLPVTKNTIIYGSNNGGITVHASCPKFNGLMKMAGKALHLKPHLAGKENPQVIYSPADIEGHLSGLDGCYYLLDFARTMPPQIPIQKKGKCHLYELLRPELVRAYKKPLSPDALVLMGRFDPDQKIHNDEIKEASVMLFQEIIPKFAETITKKSDILITPTQPRMLSHFETMLDNLNPEEIIQKLHRSGINIRHIGLVRHYSRNLSIKQLLLCEMVARVLKDMINAETRRTMKIRKIPSDEPYRAVVINILNRIFVKERDTFWYREMKKLITDKFPGALFPNEEAKDYNLIENIDVKKMLSRFGYITCIIIKEDSVPVLDFGSSMIVDSDLLEMDAKVKGMNIISEATAMVLQYSAAERCGSEAKRLIQLAINHFKQAISESPNSRFAFYEFGRMLHKISLQQPDGDDAILLFTEAIEKLQEAVAIDPSFHDSTIELADTILDFVVYPRRLWLIYRKDNREFLQNLSALIEQVGRHLDSVIELRNLNYSADLKDTQLLPEAIATKNISKVRVLIQNSSDIKLLCILEASLEYRSLTDLVKATLKKKTTFRIEEEGVTFFKNETFIKLANIAKNLKQLTLQHAIQIDDATIDHIIKKLTDLEGLSLSGCEKLTKLPHLPSNLTQLYLSGCNVIPILDHLKPLLPALGSITHLSFDGCNVTDDHVGTITAAAPHLVHLSLSRATDHLHNTCHCRAIVNPTIFGKNLMYLNFGGCVNLKNPSLVSLSKNGAPLVYLCLARCSSISDAGIVPLLKRNSHLQFLDLTATAITETTLKTIGSYCPNLENLKLGMCFLLKGTNLKKVMDGCPSLKKLDLDFWKKEIIDPLTFESWGETDNSNYSWFMWLSAQSNSNNVPSPLEQLSVCYWECITNKNLEHILCRCPNLTNLNLSRCFQITNNALSSIANVLGPKLKQLVLLDCPVISKEGIQALSKYCTNLTSLTLDDCTEVDGLAVRALGNDCRNLETLGLNGLPKISNDDIQYLLLRCTKMQKLGLQYCTNITTDFIYHKLRHQCANLTIELMEQMRKNCFFI